jgi:hypothetical protein
MNWVILVILNRIYQTPLLLSAYKVLKYLIHATTQTSEIYRLCNSTIVTSRQLIEDEKEEQEIIIESVSKDIIYRIDRSIYYSTQLSAEKQQLSSSNCQINAISKSIALKKQFLSTNEPAIQVLSFSLNRIYESNQLLQEIEFQVTTKYDTANTQHEAKLIELWNNLKPDTPLESRHTKQWTDIGFQGNDPATDFRGMGIQGLEDLLYFSSKHAQHAQSTLQHASHPIYWYPYAIVGINITKFAYQVLESKKLQLYLFQYGANAENWHEFYCWLFVKFNQFWIEHEPKLTVMDFEAKFIEFKKAVEKDLLVENVVPFSIYKESLILVEIEEQEEGEKNK